MANITWEVTWNEAVGYVIFYVGDKQACHLNIRESTTVMNTGVPYDENGRMWWGQDIRMTQFHSALRPFNFTISFNVARGFSITYQGNVVGTLPNRLNVTDPNSFRIVTSSSKIQVTDVDALRALDNSETEYNRMLSRHMTQHRILMDDLMKLSTESGSGSGSGPRDLLKKQKAEADQAALVKRIGTTMSALNASEQRLMKSAPQFMDETKASDKKTAQLIKSGDQKGAQFIRDIDAYEALIDTINSREGFENASRDGALEVSQLKRESHKYMFAILGVVALYAFYKTLKQIKNVNFK